MAAAQHKNTGAVMPRQRIKPNVMSCPLPRLVTLWRVVCRVFSALQANSKVEAYLEKIRAERETQRIKEQEDRRNKVVKRIEAEKWEVKLSNGDVRDVPERLYCAVLCGSDAAVPRSIVIHSHITEPLLLRNFAPFSFSKALGRIISTSTVK